MDEQYKRLVDFRDNWCQPRGLLQPYTSPDDFKQKFNRHLATKINDDPYFKVAEEGDDGAGMLAFVPRAEHSTPTLSEEAKALLLAGADDRNGHIMHLKYISGVSMQANGKDFIEDKSPRSRAKWEGALDELVSFGFVKGIGQKGEIFQVTRDGYAMAELLRG